MNNAQVSVYDKRYVSLVEKQFDGDAAHLVSKAMTLANDMLAGGSDNTSINTEVENALLDLCAEDAVIKLGLIGAHACVNGWDDAAPFFLEENYPTVEGDQNALVDWVRSGRWIGEE